MIILQIHNFYQHQGGEDNVVKFDAKILKQFNHKVVFLSAHNNDVNIFFHSRKVFYQSLKEILDTYQFDLAHIHNVYHIIGNEVYELLASKHIPIVQTLHNFRFLCPAGSFMDNDNQICERCIHGNFTPCFTKKCYQHSYVKSFVMKELVNRGRTEVLKNVSVFVALNEFYKSKYVEAGFSEESIVVKPNFIFGQEFSLPIHKNFGLFMGRISPEKGIEMLINAFIGLSFKLKIAGTGEESYLKKLKEIAKNSPNIEFVGFMDGENKKTLLKESSFLLLPSIWYENFPITALEAYSFGKPVIASNIGGLPSIIKNQETGLLFEAGNAEALKEAINKIIENEHFIQLGKNGYQYYQENFTEKQNYPQLMEIYERAIAAKKLKNDTSKTY